MRATVLSLVAAVAPFLASASPTYAPTPTLNPSPTTTTTVCPTTCSTTTLTVHPGYRCPTDAPGSTLGCPVARCIYQTPVTVIVTSILPCSTVAGACTTPQSCLGVPVSTVEVSPTTCPTDCPVLCPKPTVTESRLLGGGCPMTA